MKVHPFIEAEKVAGYGVQTACRLLEVSRAAFYVRLDPTPSAKDASDAELTEKITAIHSESKGTYGSHRSIRSWPRAARAAGGGG